MKTVVAVVLTVLMIGVMMIPVINALGEDKEVTTTVTLSNRGSPFALANADSESHPIIMSVDGDQLIVTSDGSPVSTGLGNVLPSVIAPVNTGPFNTYYVAINLASGDNSDDAGETRLSKEKGEIAYLLNANNLHQTAKGYTFDPTLYNVMLVIPPVYWYSELDSGSTDTGKLYMASSPDAFVSMGITADKLKDYAHTYTSEGVVGHAPAIAIGVYEGYNDNGVLVSQSGRTPTFSVTLSDFVGFATNGNTDNNYGVYQLWNWYQWILYRMMGNTVMGNMDSQYMMGAGPTSGSVVSITGITSSAYTKSDNSSISLFIENSWGSLGEFIGDSTTNSGTLIAGNKAGGSTSNSAVSTVLSETVTFPDSGYYVTFNPSSEVFGAPVTTQSTSMGAGEAINDMAGGTNKAITTGGSYAESGYAGLSYGRAVSTWERATSTVGARLAYLITDSEYVPPSGANEDYAYIMSYNVNGTIQNVQSIENGVATSYMPTGTTLNSYWDFEVKAVLPQLSDATNSVDLAVGSDSILQFYNSGNVVLQTATGTVDLGRVNDVTPTPVTVTVQNGVMTYNGGSANVSLYRSNSGTYVYATNNINVLNDAEIYVAQYQYGVETSNGTKDMGMIGSGTSETLSANVSLFNTPNVDTETVNANITMNENSSKINSLSVDTVFTDSDTVDYGAVGFYVPKTGSYDFTTIEKGGGMAYDLLLYMPILVVLALIVLIAGSWYYNRTY